MKHFYKPYKNILLLLWISKAEWCKTCIMTAPILNELAGELSGKAVFGKTNVDENRSVAGQFGILGIPTLLVFKKGELVDQLVGAVPCAGHCPVDAINIKEIQEVEKIELIKNWADAYAEANNFKVNPDKKVVDLVVEGLLKKEERFGKRYCPCRLENVRENVCPCVYHKDEIKKDKQCHCMIFVK